MKRAADDTKNPPPSKRIRRLPEATEEEEMDHVTSLADESQYFTPSQIHTQEEKYASIKSDSMLVNRYSSPTSFFVYLLLLYFRAKQKWE